MQFLLHYIFWLFHSFVFENNIQFSLKRTPVWFYKSLQQQTLLGQLQPTQMGVFSHYGMLEIFLDCFVESNLLVTLMIEELPLFELVLKAGVITLFWWMKI